MTTLTWPQQPSNPEFNSINIKTNIPTVKSESLSGRVQVRQLGSQKWSMTLSYPPMTRSEFVPIMTTIMQLRGSYGKFTVKLPILSTSQSSAGGSWKADGTYASGISSITCTGGSGDLAAGDFVKFSNHSKVYMVVGWVNTTNVMTIEPPLVESVTGTSTLTYNDVPFTASLNSDQQEFPVGTEGLFRYEVDIVEVL